MGAPTSSTTAGGPSNSSSRSASSGGPLSILSRRTATKTLKRMNVLMIVNEKKKVPPCLPEHVSKKELQLGKLRLVRPEAGTLPPSFYEEQYKQLLFGYFPT